MKSEIITLIKETSASMLNNPCLRCKANNNGSCCGCPKGRDYNVLVMSFKKYGDEVLNYAKAYQKFTAAKKKIWKMRKNI